MHPRPKMSGFQFRTIKIYCFWCQVFLLPREKTRDHVIPQYLGGKRTVDSCAECNGERSTISSLAKIVMFPTKKDGKTRRVNVASRQATISRYAWLFDKYMALVKDRLEGNEREVCLNEIRMAMSCKAKV